MLVDFKMVWFRLLVSLNIYGCLVVNRQDLWFELMLKTAWKVFFLRVWRVEEPCSLQLQLYSQAHSLVYSQSAHMDIANVWNGSCKDSIRVGGTSCALVQPLKNKSAVLFWKLDWVLAKGDFSNGKMDGFHSFMWLPSHTIRIYLFPTEICSRSRKSAYIASQTSQLTQLSWVCHCGLEVCYKSKLIQPVLCCPNHNENHIPH